MYYIYHIPSFIHKDGSIGKIGVSDKPDNRVKKQGYINYEILEKHECIYEVSKREIELQKEYGYPVDKVYYHISRKYWGSKAGKVGGRKTAISGHLTKIRKKYKQHRIDKVSIPVFQCDKDGNIIKEFKSQQEAAKILNLNTPNINAALKGKQKTCGGFIWKYKNENNSK